jgi:hypothetical protein
LTPATPALASPATAREKGKKDKSKDKELEKRKEKKEREREKKEKEKREKEEKRKAAKEDTSARPDRYAPLSLLSWFTSDTQLTCVRFVRAVHRLALRLARRRHKPSAS